MRGQASRGKKGVKHARRIAAHRGARVIHLRRALLLRTIVSRIELIRESKKNGPVPKHRAEAFKCNSEGIYG
jgi:hypothetical protein